MERARCTKEWVFRVYSWSEPTLSLGRNQIARGRYDLRGLAQRGIPVVRRPTGGRAILHHREVTYSVTGPERDAGSLRESYERINRLLVEGLRALGAAVEIVTTPPAAIAPGIIPCFDHPSAGELVHRGRKLVGSAQWRSDGAVLQHGSILVEDDQVMLTSLLLDTVVAPPHSATLESALGRIPTVEEVAAALFEGVRRGGFLTAPCALDADLAASMHAVLPRYLDDRWTWRR